MRSSDLRKALNIIEAHGGTEEEPNAGAKLAAELERHLETDPLADAIHTLTDAVGGLHQSIQIEHTAIHSETLAELRSTRNQTTTLLVLAMALNSALVGVGMTWSGSGLTVTPAVAAPAQERALLEDDDAGGDTGETKLEGE